jgi:hypothetical protein
MDPERQTLPSAKPERMDPERQTLPSAKPERMDSERQTLPSAKPERMDPGKQLMLPEPEQLMQKREMSQFFTKQVTRLTLI